MRSHKRPGESESLQAWSMNLAAVTTAMTAGVGIVYQESMSLARCPVPPSTGSVCLHVLCGEEIGILLVYQPSYCPTISLPELISDRALECL